jgi:hypothetical protein
LDKKGEAFFVQKEKPHPNPSPEEKELEERSEYYGKVLRYVLCFNLVRFPLSAKGERG